MLFYHYFFLLIALSFLFILIRFLIYKRKDISVDIFVIAQRSENNGYFEEAVITYEKALTEAKKRKFHNLLTNKIIEKLKVLRTVIEYKNNLNFVRQDFQARANV